MSTFKLLLSQDVLSLSLSLSKFVCLLFVVAFHLVLLRDFPSFTSWLYHHLFFFFWSPPLSRRAFDAFLCSTLCMVSHTNLWTRTLPPSWFDGHSVFQFLHFYFLVSFHVATLVHGGFAFDYIFPNAIEQIFKEKLMQ